MPLSLCCVCCCRLFSIGTRRRRFQLTWPAPHVRHLTFDPLECSNFAIFSTPKTNCAKWHKTQKHIRTFKLVPLIYLQITFKRRRWTWEIEQFSDFLSHVVWHPQFIFLEVKIIDLCKIHSRIGNRLTTISRCNFLPYRKNSTDKSSIFLFIHSQSQQRETISLGSSRSINVSWRRLTWEKWILFEENLYRRSTTTAKVRATTMSHRIWVHTIIITITFMPPPTILH